MGDDCALCIVNCALMQPEADEVEGEAGGGGGGEGDGVAGGGGAEVAEGEGCADASFDVEGGCGGRGWVER